jgi:hypothetical protein
MDPTSAVEPYLVLAGMLLVPALIFFCAFTYQRMRRSSFRHNRSQRTRPRA